MFFRRTNRRTNQSTSQRRQRGTPRLAHRSRDRRTQHRKLLLEPLENRLLLAADFVDTVPGTPGDDHWYVRSDPTGNFVEIFLGDTASGSPAYRVAKHLLAGRQIGFEGGQGDDLLTVDFSNGAPFDGQIVFDGGGVSPNFGTDRVLLKDTSATARNYQIHENRVEIRSVPSSEFDPVPTVWYSGAEHLEIAAGSGSDFFTINSSHFETPIRLFGNGGDDTFFLGQGSLFQQFDPDIVIDGGDGTDRVLLNDQYATQPGGPYFFDAVTAADGVVEGRLQKSFLIPGSLIPFVPTLFFQTGLLTTRGIEDIELQGSPFDDTFLVEGTPSGTTLTLRGNDGADEFRMDGSRVNGRINVRGGPPSTAPGDSLYVSGTRVDTGAYVPGSSSDSGRVTANGQIIDFTGLEPVYVEGFGSFTFTTPRSRDNVELLEYFDSGDARRWTQVQGTSGLHDTPFEVLRVRDIGTLELNLATADFVAEPPYFFDSNDRLTIYPYALSGNRVDLLRVIAGFGSDLISDRTLQGPPATTRLEVITAAPNVRHEFWGTPYRVELGTEPGGLATTRAYDTAGSLLHDVRQINVSDVVFTYPLNQVEYTGRDVNVTLDEGGTGLQRLRAEHAPTRFQFQTFESGQFAMQLTGDSRVAIIAILTPQPPLLRGGPGADSVTIGADSGLRLTSPIHLEGFDGNDTITFEGLRQIGQGVPMATTFGVDGRNAFVPVDPKTLIELLVNVGPDLRPVVGVEVKYGPGATGTPTMAFQGNPFTFDTARVLTPANGGFTAIELLVYEIESLTMNASDRLRFLPDVTGGLRGQAETGSGIPTMNVATDDATTQVKLRSFTSEIGYPVSDFRAVTFDTTEAIELLVTPRYTDIIGVLIAKVEQSLTPTFGRTTVGNWTVDQDPFANTTLVGSDIETRINGDFLSDDRELSLRHSLTGSTSTLLVDGARLKGLNFEALGARGAINRVAADFRDTFIEGGVQLSYEGPDAGTNYLVTNVTGTTLGVGGSFKTDIRTGGSPTTIADFSSNNTTLGGPWGTNLDTRDGPVVLLIGTADGVSPFDLNAILIGLLHPRQESAPTSILIGILMPNPDDPGFWQQSLQTTLDLLGSGTETPGTLPTIGAPLGRDLYLNGTGDVLAVAFDTTAGGTFIDPESLRGELLVVREGNVTVGAAPLLGTGIETDLLAQVCYVTNTDDSGPGSLRAAIQCANAAPGEGLAVISFAIPTTDPNFQDLDGHLPGGDPEPDIFTIGLSTPLPPLTRGNIVINGQSQQTLTGDSNSFGPEIVLLGQGLELLSSENHIHGLTIALAAQNGILIEGNRNVITGSYIGVAPTGLVEAPNALDGIQIRYGDGNIIGGSRPGDRNVISANGRFGVLIEGNGFAWPGPGDPPIYTDNPDMFRYVGNSVIGNIIGLAADGVTPLGNGTNPFQESAGVFLVDSAQNVISGNTISGNGNANLSYRGRGVWVEGGHFNTIRANFIGTTADGMSAAPNTGEGILIRGGFFTQSTSQSNTITGNVVSGNLREGIVVDGGRTRTQAEDFDSLLGIFVNGWTGFRNEENRDSFGYVDSNLTQDTPGGEAGGTFARASSALGETVDHVSYYADTDVGRFTLNDELRASGELIFTELNNFDGSVQIGYFSTEEAHADRVRSVLSLRVAEPSPNQGTTGIRVFAEIALADGTRVFGTPVNAGGGLERNVPYTWELYYNPGSGANHQGGLQVKIFAAGELIGTSFVSLTTAHRAIGATFDAFGLHNGGEAVRSNNPNTITLYVDNLRYTHVASGQTNQGNYIGTNKLGTAALANGASGLVLAYTAPTQVGGTEPGEGNVISGNSLHGIFITSGNGHTIEGNFVGTSADGLSAIGNVQDGISILDSSNNMIGGYDSSARNVIGGNFERGVRIDGLRSNENMVLSNYVGIGADGETPLGNLRGILVAGNGGNTLGSYGNIIGLPGAGNVISSNQGYNISIAAAVGTVVQGNRIETSREGVRIINARDTLIGGDQPGEGNLISGNLYGIYASGGNIPGGAQRLTIQGNRLGVNASGDARFSNNQGIYIDGYEGGGQRFELHDVLIGGTTPGAGNVVSGSHVGGIIVRGPNVSGITIQGNLIGTDVSGQFAIPNGPNGPGILLDTASGVQVGGSTTGARNVISGNTSDGIRIIGGSGHVIEGNLIGTDPSGTIAVANLGAGVRISNAIGVVIGGTEHGAGNVISGNHEGINAWLTSGLRTEGNKIGTNESGTSAIPNVSYGISLLESTGAVVGGNVPESGNLISGNSSGIYLRNGGNHVIAGNFIGTDLSGTYAIGNRVNGIYVSGSTDAQIGGSEPGAGNLISGNNWGVEIINATGARIQGNLIGTDVTGTSAINNGTGIGLLNSANNLIGGGESGSRNVISSSGTNITVFYDQSTGNRIQGNYIGVNATGTAKLGNNAHGVNIAYGANGNIVGTDSDGIDDAFEGNLISGITGVHYATAVSISSDHNVVAGNLIGTDWTGLNSIPNSVGVWIGGSYNRVGTDGNGVSDEFERNVINQLEIQGAGNPLGAQFNNVAGNYIGTDITGNARLGVGGFIHVRNNANFNVIGTNDDGNADGIEGNIIAGISGAHAIQIENARRNQVSGNHIGIGADGTTSLENPFSGVFLRFGAQENIIGGILPAQRNIIAGNGRVGVHITGDGTDGNIVVGNFIGLDAQGNALGNTQHGILLEGVRNTLIGDFTPGAGNVISANELDGIRIVGGSGNVIRENLIGLDPTGQEGRCNGWNGIALAGAATNHQILDNVISANARSGVVVVGASATGNAIRRNAIHSNGGLGIDLGGDGVTPNDRGNLAAGIVPDADTGPNGLQNFPELNNVQPGVETRVNGLLRSTPGASFVIDFYANTAPDPSGYGEGQRWLGTTTVVANSEGVAPFNVTLAATTNGGEFVTATATRLLPGGVESDTSEFSAAYAVKAGKKAGGSNSLTLEFSADSDAVPVAVGTTFDQVVLHPVAGLGELFDDDSHLGGGHDSELGRTSAVAFTRDALDDTSDPRASLLPDSEQHHDGLQQFTETIDELLNGEELDWLSELEQRGPGDRNRQIIPTRASSSLNRVS